MDRFLGFEDSPPLAAGSFNISVIVPALNEAAEIEKTLASATGAYEVIVSDGGSTDGTPEEARLRGARVVSSRPGRGEQMDAGAVASAGDVLLFLHADTTLPEGWCGAVKRAFDDKNVVAGAFSLSIDSGGRIFRLIERGADLRARRFGLIYGDQALFVKRDAFFACGGFRKLPLMEDVDCVKRLRKLGRVVVRRERVKTSARRWKRRGITPFAGAVKTTLRNWSVLLLYFAGVSPYVLCRLYYPGNPHISTKYKV